MFALGSAQRSTLLVDDLSPALAATLGLLTAALDDPGADIAVSVGALGAAAAAAIGSYLGLTVCISGPSAPGACGSFGGGGVGRGAPGPRPPRGGGGGKPLPWPGGPRCPPGPRG